MSDGGHGVIKGHTQRARRQCRTASAKQDFPKATRRCGYVDNLLPWYLVHGLGHGCDDALLDHNPRLCCLLVRLLRDPVRTQGQSEGSLVLRLGLVLMRQLRRKVFVVLFTAVSFPSSSTASASILAWTGLLTFLLRFSLMMTFFSLASLRSDCFTPSCFFINRPWCLFFSFSDTPSPTQLPQPGILHRTSKHAGQYKHQGKRLTFGPPSSRLALPPAPASPSRNQQRHRARRRLCRGVPSR